MKKNILIWIIGMILLMSFVSAWTYPAGYLPGKTYRIYNIDEGSGSVLEDSLNYNLNATFINTPDWKSTGFKGSPSLYLGSGEGILWPVGTNADVTSDGAGWCAWVNATYNDNSNAHIFTDDKPVSRGEIWNYVVKLANGTYKYNVEFRDAVDYDVDSPYYDLTATDNEWVYYCAFYNTSTDKQFYIDGVKVKTSTFPIVDYAWENYNHSSGCAVRYSGCSGSNSIMEIAEMVHFNQTLTQQEVLDIYNLYNTPAQNKINGTSQFPENNTQYNTENIDFNATVNASIQFNCSLYIGGVLNRSGTYSSGKNVFVNFTMPINDGNYTYKFSCYNATDYSDENTNSTEKTFYIDSVFPNIVSTLLSESILYESLNATFNFVDESSIFSYNITLQTAGGTNTPLAYQDNILNKTIQYNLNYDISNLTAGDYVVHVVLADGHTAKKLKGDYSVSNGMFDDYLEFGVYNGNNIKIKQKDGSLFDSWNAEKGYDRYSFKFKPNKLKNKYTFVVTSDEEIHIIEKEDSKYKKWLVIGENWLDFYPYTNVEIKKVKKGEVEVTVSDVDPTLNEIEFQSIGDLNIIQANYVFNKVNMIVSYTNSIAEKQEQDITLRINKDANINSTNATFKYNVTSYNVTKQTFIDYDLYTVSFTTPEISLNSKSYNFNWTYSIEGLYNTLTGEIVNSQTVTKILIDNCSTFSMEALSLDLRTKYDNNLINGSVDGYFRVWVNEDNNFREFNLTWKSGSEYGLCISPNETTYTAYGQLVYSAPDWDERTYYFNNVSLDNVSETINLYLTNGTSLVEFSVLDEDDDAVSNVLIKVLTYDIATDTSEVVEILKSDSDGKAIGNIILNTQWYKFILEKDGEILFLSDPVKITSTQKTFRINTQTNYFSNYGSVKDTIGDVYFTNATKTFTYTFSDSTGATITACLEVKRRIMAGDTTISKECINSNAGTINYIITENVSSNTYVGTGYIVVEGLEYVIDVASVSFNERYKDWGLEGIFVTFLIVLTLAMVGVSGNNPALAIMFMLIGFIGSIMLSVFFLNWSVLIVFIIIGGIVMYKLTR